MNQFTEMGSVPVRSEDEAEGRILDAWRRNADAWSAAVRGGAIASRRRVTDRAVLDAVLARRPRSVLDLGCGEGWLARALAGYGVVVTGIDATPELISTASRAGGGQFRLIEYSELGGAALGQFDVVVCNFSLLGKDSTEAALRAIPALLGPAGRLVIQTLHPSAAGGDADHDGWRCGSWCGCGSGFGDPAPWYFRTTAGWLELLESCGLGPVELDEPRYPDDGRPASLILSAGRR